MSCLSPAGPFSLPGSWEGALAFAGGQEGEQAQVGHGHLTNTTLDWGVPGQAKEATTSEHPPLVPPLPPPGLFGARHSGPNGLRACICLKNNKFKQKEFYQPHHCVGRAWGQHGDAPGRWPTGSVACELA